MFWDMTPCSPLKVNRLSEEHFASIFRIKPETSIEEEPNNGLHGVISQKLELFITTGVRTSDTT
jgi:hypothetical protein